MTGLPEEFRSQLNNYLFPKVIELYYTTTGTLRTLKDLPAFYLQWTHLYNFPITVVNEIKVEMRENEILIKVIDKDDRIPTGVRNYLLSAKHREDKLSFVVAIFYNSFRTKTPVAALFEEYVDAHKNRDPQTVIKRMKQTTHLRIASLEETIEKQRRTIQMQQDEIVMLKAKPFVTIKNTSAASKRKAGRRSKKNIV